MKNMLEVAKNTVLMAQKKGAQQVAANSYHAREVAVTWRDGAIEKLHEATTSGLSLQLYVDGRYSAVSTSDLRPEAIDKFIDNSISLARALAPDQFRALPDPKLYENQAQINLMLEDATYDSITASQRKHFAQIMEDAARSVKGAESIISVATEVTDGQTESFKVHSNGFEGSRRDTAFWFSAEVSVKDPDGRRPEDYDYAGGRFFKELPDPVSVGRSAAERALRRIGAQKIESALMSAAIDPRSGGRLFSFLISPLAASSLQQKRSMYEGKLGTTIGSELLDVKDDPLIIKGLGSRLYDSEGITAKSMSIFEKGKLCNFYIDNYYGKKLKMAPTTAGISNLTWKLGDNNLNALLKQMNEGIIITGFLGGNSNGTTGDFSLGIQGYRVRNGIISEPVAEMNLSGNHLEFWKRLAAVGNDPYPYSPLRTPTLIFDKVQIAGI